MEQSASRVKALMLYCSVMEVRFKSSVPTMVVVNTMCVPLGAPITNSPTPTASANPPPARWQKDAVGRASVLCRHPILFLETPVSGLTSTWTSNTPVSNSKKQIGVRSIFSVPTMVVVNTMCVPLGAHKTNSKTPTASAHPPPAQWQKGVTESASVSSRYPTPCSATPVSEPISTWMWLTPVTECEDIFLGNLKMYKASGTFSSGRAVFLQPPNRLQ
ncbi:uncharacterized protein [Salvelinus alpinus]|uniref:uncharacterized protein isoform X2 n=2 Tax=Salvelinus alpinus TaxID=8036 RepID=UPI0039FBA3DA